MTVPKASVDENGCAVFPQNDIRLAWQAFDIHPVTETVGIKELSHNHFRFCVASFYASHYATALFRCQCVGHDLLFSAKIKVVGK